MTTKSFRRVIESTLVPHTAFADASARLQQCLDYARDSPEPICFAIVGESRTGKSRILEECEREYMPRRTEAGLTVPVVRVSAPAKPTAKSLSEVLLRKLGDPKWDAGTENNKMARLEKLLKACECRMLMIDEFQHFFDKTTHKVFHHVADWLKLLADNTRVALVVTGLDSCLPVLLRNEQLSGRFLSPAFMHRFNWLDDDHRAEFIGILEAFNESISVHLDLPRLHSDEMAFRFWCATGGLMGYLTKLLRQLVWNACDQQLKKISLADIRKANEEAIWSLDEAARAMNPFLARFSCQPTQDMIAFSLGIGVREEEPFPKGSFEPKKRPSGTSASQHLSAA